MQEPGIQMNELYSGPPVSSHNQPKKRKGCSKICIILLTLLTLANSVALILYILDSHGHIDLGLEKDPSKIIVNNNDNNDNQKKNNNVIVDINKNHKVLVDVKDVPVILNKRIWSHIIDVSNSESAYNLEETTIDKVTAIYKKDSNANEIDYYEVKLSENGVSKGYLTLTANSGQDYVIPEFSTTEKLTPSEKLLISTGSTKTAKKIVKYNAEGDLSVYDKDNRKLGDAEIINNNSTCGCNNLERLEVEKENERQWEEVREDAVEEWKYEDEITKYGSESSCDGITKLIIHNGNYDSSIPSELSNYLSLSIKDTKYDHKILEISSTAPDKLCLVVERLEKAGNYDSTRFTIYDGGDKIDMYVAGRVSKDGINQDDVDSDDSDTASGGRRLWSGSKSKPWQPWHYYWVSGTVPDYKQHSCCGCISGCGPVAWAQSFGWADRKAQSSSSWSKNIYLSNGASGSSAIAPSSWPSTSAGQKPIKNFIEDIRDKVDTFCFFGSGATTLWDMDDVNGWFKARNGGSGGVSTKYNIFGWKEDRLMKCARYEIKNLKQPVVLGTGWLKHYPSGVGYAYRKRRRKACWICPWYWQVSRWFYVKQGWGGYLNKWIPAKTFFCGRIRS